MKIAFLVALVTIGFGFNASAQSETYFSDLKDLNISVRKIGLEFRVPAEQLSAKLEQMLQHAAFAHDAIRIAFVDTNITFQKNKVRIAGAVNVNGIVDFGFYKRNFENQKVKLGATIHFDINNWKIETSVSDLSLKTGIKMVDMALTVGNDYLETFLKEKFDRQLQDLFAGKTLKEIANEHVARFQNENNVRQVPSKSDLKVEIVPQGLDVNVQFFDQGVAVE